MGVAGFFLIFAPFGAIWHHFGLAAAGLGMLCGLAVCLGFTGIILGSGIRGWQGRGVRRKLRNYLSVCLNQDFQD